MFDVMDVFELPEQWRVEPWPDFRPPLTGTGDWGDTVTEVGAEGMWGADAKWIPGGREDEIEHVIQQAAQMTRVVRDRAARSYHIGTGADRIVLGRDWLLVLPDEKFEEAKLRIWNACEASEASRRAAWR